MTTPPESDPASPLRIPLTLVLALLAPPLALVSWILLSGGQRLVYLRSRWVRAGMVIFVLGAAPLFVVGVAAAIGLWPDPNPNPIGLGLLFLGAGVVACLSTLIGVLWVAAHD